MLKDVNNYTSSPFSHKNYKKNPFSLQQQSESWWNFRSEKAKVSVSISIFLLGKGYSSWFVFHYWNFLDILDIFWPCPEFDESRIISDIQNSRLKHNGKLNS